MFSSKRYGPEASAARWLGVEAVLDARLPGLSMEQEAVLSHDHWSARKTFEEYVSVLLGYEYHAWECETLLGLLFVVRRKMQRGRWIPDEQTYERMENRQLEAKAEYMTSLVLASRLFRADRETTTRTVLDSLPIHLNLDELDAVEKEAHSFQPEWNSIRGRTMPPAPTKEQHQSDVMQEFGQEFGYRIRG